MKVPKIILHPGKLPPYIRTQLEKYAATTALVAIHPQRNT